MSEADMRRRLAELEQRCELAEGQAALGSVASYAMHEINNQTTVLLASIDLSQLQLEQLSERADRATRASLSAVRDSLDIQVRAVERISDILEQLRCFSRKRPVDEGPCAPFDLAALVERMVRVLGNRLRQRAIVTTDLSVCPLVAGDDKRIAQVVLNLLNNALDSLADKSYLDSRIKIAVRPVGEMVELSVADTGCGIPTDHRERLFEPYFTSKRDTGTGIGLAVCADIVARCGGRIAVESEVGRGTTFRVLLPVALEGQPGSRGQGSRRAVRRRRVLLVDDDRRVRAQVSALLALYHDVVVAENGAAAIATLTGDSGFDAIVCDLMMPGKDGVMVLDEVRERFPQLASRFAFLTGGGFTPQAQRLIETGEIAVLHKPCRLEELLGLVDRLAERG